MPLDAIQALNGPDVSEPTPGQPLQPQPITVQDISSSLAPLTNRAAAASLKRYGPAVPTVTQGTPSLTQDQQFISENQRPGVPLYTDTAQDPGTSPLSGAVTDAMGFTSPMLRYNIARRRTSEDQLAYAKSVLGDENARLANDGHEIIVSLPDTSPGATPGKQKDVLLNEHGLTVGDLASVAAHWPEAAGALMAVAGMRSGKLAGIKGLGRYLLDVASGSLGQAAGGAAGDVATRLTDRPPGEPIDIGEITGTRFISEMPGDIAGNLVAGAIQPAAGAASRFLQAPLSHARTETQILGLAAIKRLEDSTGVKLLLSPGEASGFPFLVAGESYIGAQPAGATAIKAMKTANDQSVRAIADAISAPAQGVTDESIGNQLIGQLQAIRNDAETAVASTAASAESSANAGIASKVATATGGIDATSMEAGAGVRGALETQHGQVMAKKNALYSDAYATPGANEAIAPTAGIEKTLKDIKANLPSHEVTVPTVEYNQYGGAMEGQKTTTQPIREFIHPEVGQFLSTKLDPNMKLSQLVEMRDLLWDEINRGEAVQSIPTRYLKQVSHSISDAIRQGVDALPNGDFKSKLKLANDFYKNQVLKFEEAGVRPMFKGITEPGYIESSSFVSRTISQPEQYFRVLNLLGPKSAAANALRQQFARGLINKSGTSLFPQRIDAQKFLQNLNELATNPNTEDIYKDVFGSVGDQLRNEAALLGRAQGTISTSDAMNAVQGDRAKLVRIQNMIDAQKKLDVLKSNQLIKEYTAGKLELNAIDPEQFVEGFVNTAKKTDLEHLMREISNDPALEQNIRRKLTEKILFKAGPNLTDTTILKALGDKNEAAKFKIVLGDAQFGLLKDFATALGPRRAAVEYASGTASLVKGSAVSRFLRAAFSMTAPTKELLQIAEYKFASLVISSPLLRNWINQTPKELWPDLTKAIFMSTPFVEALRQDIRDPTTMGNSVNAIRRFIGPGQTPARQPAQAPRGNAIDALNQP